MRIMRVVVCWLCGIRGHRWLYDRTDANIGRCNCGAIRRHVSWIWSGESWEDAKGKWQLFRRGRVPDIPNPPPPPVQTVWGVPDDLARCTLQGWPPGRVRLHASNDDFLTAFWRSADGQQFGWYYVMRQGDCLLQDSPIAHRIRHEVTDGNVTAL